jgi:hypothetical protein
MTVNEEISVPEVSEFVFAVGDGGWLEEYNSIRILLYSKALDLLKRSIFTYK